MTERDIEFLLDLYQKNYVKGEIRNNESKKRIRHEAKRKHRHLVFDGLLSETKNIKSLHMNNNQIKMVRYLIDEFNLEFQELHRRTSEECIILSFMFYVKMIDQPKINVGSYEICSRHKLTDNVFETIVCRMLLKFMKKCPIVPYHNYNNDEHDRLITTGER